MLSCMGDNVVPTAWKQSNAFNNLRLASNLSNSMGMNEAQTILYNLNGSTPANGSIPAEPTNANNVSWLTSFKTNAPETLNGAAANGKVWVVADLGGTYSLSSIRLWNFQWQLGSSNLADRGINQFDVLVRNADVDTTTGLPGQYQSYLGE